MGNFESAPQVWGILNQLPIYGNFGNSSPNTFMKTFESAAHVWRL